MVTATGEVAKSGVRVILVALGSAGDTFPLIGLGAELRRRGHRVVVVAIPHFRREIEGAGVDFHPLGTEEDYVRVMNNPDVWRPLKGLRVLAAEGSRTLRETYCAIAKLHEPGNTVCVASTLGMAARIARETLSIPMATVHSQPIVLRGAEDPPIGPDGRDLGFLPAGAVRAVYWLLDTLVVDPFFGRAVNRFRREFGLAPVRRIFADWMHSPDMVLGGFPEWFAPVQRDWPRSFRHTGFPLYDAAESNDLDPELDRFLSAGPAPVVFTFGTAMRFCRDLMRESVEAVERGGFRGLLLVRDRGLAPAVLPASVAHFPYVPFSRILPRARALVHHGGIGTSSQALAAGCPQLVVPFGFDQPDNFNRLRRLGVAVSVAPASYRADAVARALKDLTGSPSVRDACSVVAGRIRDGNDPGGAAAAVEDLIARSIRPG